VVRRDLGHIWDIIPVERQGGEHGMGFDLLSASDRERLFRLEFDLVVNASAMSSTAVCSENAAECIGLNTLWPRLLAAVCRERSIPMVHFSSDLVHSGGNPPYSENSPAVPLSLYGWSKLLADTMIMRINPDAVLVRTSVLCGETPSVRRTFSQDVLLGRIRKVWVDSWRNHTPLSWLAGLLPELVSGSVRGLVVATGKTARTRAAYAEALLRKHGMPTEHLVAEYSPPGVPSMLDMRGAYSVEDDIV
jgi:dTDP-4-dehydrorhamnose reductase